MKNIFQTTSVLCAGTFFLLAAGCSDGMIEHQEGTIVEQAPKHTEAASELMYLKNPEAAKAAFAGGVATFIPKRAFFGAGIMVTAQGDLGMSYRAKSADGTWGQWIEAQSNTHNEKYHEIHLEVPAGGVALELKTEALIEFVRVEFSHSLETEHKHDFSDDVFQGESQDQASLTDSEAIEQGIAIAGRWALPSSVRSAGEANYIAYNSAPSYNGGRNCSGTFTKGAKELGQYLVATFPGAKYFQGYNCRQIRGRSGMSMHGTGRAIDVFIPLDGGQADNTLGDPVANWLVENAKAIGIQYIVWDRASWGGHRSGRKDRNYTGAHPHHDHLHIELTKAGSVRQTQWFANRGVATDPNFNPGPAPSAGSCYSNSLGKRVDNGEGVQVNYASSCAGGGTCGWYKCNSGKWTCTDPAQTTKQNPHAACKPAAPAPSVTCKSNTLGRDVPAGEYVQMPYAACNSSDRCLWAQCGNDGNWKCGAPTANATQHAHAQCAAPTIGPGACSSYTVGSKVPEGGRVQMAYDACGGTCQWAECQNTKWVCVNNGTANASYPHNSCK